MNRKKVKKQIKAIRKATKKACKSKESARKFLIDAGIIKDESIYIQRFVEDFYEKYGKIMSKLAYE